MKIRNMTSSNGNDVPNQFIIEEEGRGALGNFTSRQTFQSYATTIAVITVWPDARRVVLDAKMWDYSGTTSKYRNKFLGERTAETEAKIKSGEYTLEDLNK